MTNAAHILRCRLRGLMTCAAPVIVLNKADIVSKDVIDALCRQVMLDKGVDCVSISAIRRESLQPMVEKIAAVIGKFEVATMQSA